MAPASPAKCANCGKKATLRCTGCLDAPKHEPDDLTSIVYCGSDCQKTHWPSHKAQCKAMQLRKKLERLAIVLKTALTTYRETLFDFDLKKIRFQNGVLYLQHVRVQSVKMRVAFPNRLTANPKHKDAALMATQCLTALALSSRLTEKLLKGTPWKTNMVQLRIDKPRMTTQFIPGDHAHLYSHVALWVKRPLQPCIDEVWIIDPTGSQYGFSEVLVPGSTYMEERGGQMLDMPNPYDWNETSDLDMAVVSYVEKSDMTHKEDWSWERKIRGHFAKFVDSHVASDMLDGSHAEFQAKLDLFKSGLKAHLEVFASK